MSATDLPGFTPRNERLAKKLAGDPDHAAAVAEIVAEIDEADRAYKMQLAAVRKAGHLTQQEVAARLGIQQGAVSKLESRQDVLWSTLLAYLSAAGAQDVTLTAMVGGKRVEIALAAAAADDE
ncbi:helix-turn-helix domain-containing protein [Myceligenerans indicum]|uniref:Helix-turn-helix transcriptional regulator n=1 Tax=Myceligenerans indicum TaxID=2593663 RepID=A0ABS1LMV3_9MICO|nr:helix-turn-helix transcriptional regulator [Myceligenerans indicum]MBL0887602.1 helix-turn-helix transcriptional regulator [Myceligenerans indicum]